MEFVFVTKRFSSWSLNIFSVIYYSPKNPSAYLYFKLEKAPVRSSVCTLLSGLCIIWICSRCRIISIGAVKDVWRWVRWNTGWQIYMKQVSVCSFTVVAFSWGTVNQGDIQYMYYMITEWMKSFSVYHWHIQIFINAVTVFTLNCSGTNTHVYWAVHVC